MMEKPLHMTIYELHQCNVIKQLEQRIAELQAEQAWVPVSERLPEIGRSVLCCYTGVYNHRVAVYWVDAGGNGHFQCKEKGSQPVTHWMPIPAPPTAQGEQPSNEGVV